MPYPRKLVEKIENIDISTWSDEQIKAGMHCQKLLNRAIEITEKAYKRKFEQDSLSK